MVKKAGILIGFIALFIALVCKIPIYPPEYDINFRIFILNNTEYYLWGYVIDTYSSYSPLILQFPENLVTIILWGFFIFIGVSSIMASTNIKYKVILNGILKEMTYMELGLFLTTNSDNIDKIEITLKE